ncbi:MAG: hypothetical protein KDA89_17960 [Planctomycetaceae bacterium]|nr:hypothetical protein [Planctomycetaceae bacterium]
MTGAGSDLSESGRFVSWSGGISQWSLHFPRLVRIAHRALGHLPHRIGEAEDAAQSALISFWQRLDQHGLSDTLDHNSLWKLLATITIRKAQQVVRREHAQKRGGGKVVRFSELQPDSADWSVSNLLAHIPSEDLDLACEELLELLPPELRQFALLRLFSHTNAEIAEILSCTERKVERKLNLIRSHWSRPDQERSTENPDSQT